MFQIPKNFFQIVVMALQNYVCMYYCYLQNPEKLSVRKFKCAVQTNHK